MPKLSQLSDYEQYDSLYIAQEIVNLFAKCQMPYNSMDEVFEVVKKIMGSQTVVPTEITVRHRGPSVTE